MGPSATDATDAPQTTTTNPYAIPQIIDVAYVDRVLAGLDTAISEAFRLYLKERQISPEVSDRIRALYGTGDGYDVTRRTFESERDSKLTTVPGNRVTTVTRLITATPTCVYTQVLRDYRPVGGTVGDSVQWVGLRVITVFNDPARYNPTPWIYVVDGFKPDRSEPPNPCSAS